MQIASGNTIPDVEAEARMSDAIIMRIKKLRWMGHDEETVKLARFLAQMPDCSTILSAPLETD